MALTRADCESTLVKRLKVLMEAAELVVTITGSNADLNDPLAWALRRVGGSTASVATVTDAELAAVGASSYDDFMDLAEYRTLQNILGNLDLVDITAGPRAEKLSQIARQVREMLKARESFAAGFVAPPTAGYISLDFAEHGEAVL